MGSFRQRIDLFGLVHRDDDGEVDLPAPRLGLRLTIIRKLVDRVGIPRSASLHKQLFDHALALVGQVRV